MSGNSPEKESKTGKIVVKKKRTNSVGVRLTDEHMEKLAEYCAATGAYPSGVINALAESYIQKMINENRHISPNILRGFQ
jgi:hypothetical protein